MKRLILLSAHVMVLFCSPGMAQGGNDLLDWKAEYTVRTHLLQKMHDQYDLRRASVSEALKSRESMLAYRDECRQKYLGLLGPFPEKTPLNPQVTKTVNLEGYRIENVLFESLPKHHVAANFYIPDGEGPFPAALIFCGHEMKSKATASYQKTAILFAKNGFAALVVDPISQGEMVQFTDENGIRILRGSTTEHTLLNAGANLVGNNVVTYELFDNIRSLDYLLSRPEVDADRVGCLGNSGGGTQTTFFMGFEERVKVAAPCSNMTRVERKVESGGASDGCQQLPFEGMEQLEMDDYAIIFAPKPLMILAGRYDFVDYTGTKQTATELQRVYAVLDEQEKFELFTVDDGHGISKPKREAAVRWFRRWLCDDNRVVIEPELEVQSEKNLNCTPNGQVNDMFPDEWNVQDMNLAGGKALDESRKAFAGSHDLVGYQQQIRKLLAIEEQQKKVEEKLVGVENKRGYTIWKYILRKEGEIPLPCLVFKPERLSANPKLKIYLPEEGKAAVIEKDSLVESCMQKGDLLILADLRGFGETMEREDANEWKYYNREYHNAIISLRLGRPLVGQRVTDLFTLLDFIKEYTVFKGNPVHLVASGAAGPVAIYAAMFRTEVRSVEVTNSIRSYFDILNHPMELDWYSYVVPNVLAYYDLPDLAGLREDLEISYQGEKSRIEDPAAYKNRKIE